MKPLGPATVAATAALVLGAAGCEPYGAYCEDRMNCLRGNDMDVDACIIELEAEEDRADLWGCADLWEELQDCREEFSVCDANDHFTDEDRCDSERERYHRCMP
ncbi:MAG: hypothetical protein JRI23_36535 [Deltaproteobacteria bacterium]|jgi:hypothetical protein|nr:hypothetical protein [Deltaproteobacteria bacterium]MBW2537864.1 hypothetical protein [Deltaproteobacteria bacterium]